MQGINQVFLQTLSNFKVSKCPPPFLPRVFIERCVVSRVLLLFNWKLGNIISCSIASYCLHDTTFVIHFRHTFASRWRIPWIIKMLFHRDSMEKGAVHGSWWRQVYHLELGIYICYKVNVWHLSVIKIDIQSFFFKAIKESFLLSWIISCKLLHWTGELCNYVEIMRYIRDLVRDPYHEEVQTIQKMRSHEYTRIIVTLLLSHFKIYQALHTSVTLYHREDLFWCAWFSSMPGLQIPHNVAKSSFPWIEQWNFSKMISVRANVWCKNVQ